MQSPARRILLAVTGLTPQVVTETLYALACGREDAWIPTEIHLITTATGAENAWLNLLAGQAWFHRLVADYQLPDIHFPPENIHILHDARGEPLDDIRSPEQNTLAADFITEWVRRLTADKNSELHVSIAGGRKTMGYYLGYALSLYGRPQDRLSHVLVSEPFETNREFYYPTPYDHPIHGRQGAREITVNARQARVDLAEIPFVRLREGLPDELLSGQTCFSRAVAAAQCSGREPALVLHPATRQASAQGEALRLTPQNFALLYWMARRRQENQGPLHITSYAGNPEYAHEFLELCKALFGRHSTEYERTAAALHQGMDSNWFSPAKTRLEYKFIQALGKNAAQPYLIRNVGDRRNPRFELTLEPHHIHIQP